MTVYSWQKDYIDSMRKAGYQQESDPIFFQWQRGEKTEQEWLDAIDAINARFPYPTAE